MVERCFTMWQAGSVRGGGVMGLSGDEGTVDSHFRGSDD